MSGPMDPLGITAAAVGIAVPVIHYVHLLLKDIDNIIDAPPTILRLKEQLRYVQQANTSLTVITDDQWRSLGENMVGLYKTATATCDKSCAEFRLLLQHWTRHSGSDGKLAWKDRAFIGIFKQRPIDAISKQLLSCKAALILVASTATLYISIQQKDLTGLVLANIMAKIRELEDAIGATDRDIADAGAALAAVRLEEPQQDSTEAERLGAISQSEMEQHGLQQSKKLLEELLSNLRLVAEDASKRQGNLVVTFGNQRKGVQMINNYAPIQFGR